MLPSPDPRLTVTVRPAGNLKCVFLSLGSNLGDRLANLRGALEQFAEAGLEVRRVSSFYKTQPQDFGAQPWFLNCVAEVATELMPMQLLKTLKSIERALGRRPGVSRGPRPIDIDILLYENVIVRSSVLTIPHERMGERRFVLTPLCELAPHLRHPVTQRDVTQMLADTPDKSQIVRLKQQPRIVNGEQ
jgi:2-amino-4-hydroxy-6-hydroxymethyldihydropteridine diphosphokinase